MTLENKMPWITLENLLKDLTTYDPKQVIETLLKALKKLHLKILKNNQDYTINSLPGVDDIEGAEEERFHEKTSLEVIGETKIVRDLDEEYSSIGDNNSVNEDITESVEDDIEILEVVRETIEEEIPFDKKKQTNDLDVTCDNEYLGKNVDGKVQNAVNEIENEWYTFVTNDKVEDAGIVENGEINFTKDKSNLKRHKRNHTGEVPFEINFQAEEEQQLIDANGKMKTFQCTLCQKSFKNLSNFRKHERVHTGEAPYECKTCKKRFKQIGHLKIHEIIHTEEMPYECKTCTKRFNHISSLKIHVRIHTGEVTVNTLLLGWY